MKLRIRLSHALEFLSLEASVQDFENSSTFGHCTVTGSLLQDRHGPDTVVQRKAGAPLLGRQAEGAGLVDPVEAPGRSH